MADLELKQISKSFNGACALSKVDFCANCGEVHALLGENGAGKSTLIKILSGALQPDEGSISLFGKKLKIRIPKDAIEAGIGTVYQELSLLPDLSVAENIFISASSRKRFKTVSLRDLKVRANEILRKYGIEDIDVNAKVGEISLARQQIIEIIKVLSKDPKVIIFDEATSALTENRVRWLLDLAKRLADEGKIIIFISHRMAEIKDGCDRMTIFRNGQNVGEMEVDESQLDKMVSLMLGRKMTGYYPEKSDVKKDDVLLETAGMSVEGQLKDISISLHAGEVLGVGGLAGQGQTALFLSLYGLNKSSGEIRVAGKRTTLKSPKKSLEHGIALIPEDRRTQGLIMPLSIEYNISLAKLKKISRGIFLSRGKESETVSKYMRMLEIKSSGPSAPVMSLSGGNQQKVVLAKLLAVEPKIILMYDITRGVDIGTKKEIFTLVKDLAAQGIAVLFYSTDMDELINVCNEVIVMHDGMIKARLRDKYLTKENIMLASIGEECS